MPKEKQKCVWDIHGSMGVDRNQNLCWKLYVSWLLVFLWWATLASMLRGFSPNLKFCYKNRTPGSDPTKGGLSMGNVVKVDLEKKSQRAQPILTSYSGTCWQCVLQRPEMTFKWFWRILSKCAHKMQSVTPITYPDQNMSFLRLAATVFHLGGGYENVISSHSFSPCNHVWCLW